MQETKNDFSYLLYLKDWESSLYTIDKYIYIYKQCANKTNYLDKQCVNNTCIAF